MPGVILFKAHQPYLVYQDTEPIVISSEDIEVVIGSDEDEPEVRTSSDIEELPLVDQFGAFKGKTFDFSVKLINPDKMSDFQTIQIGKATTFSSLADLKAFISQHVSQLPNMLSDIESVECGYLEPGHGAKGKKVWIYKDDDVVRNSPWQKEYPLMVLHTRAKSQCGCI